MCAWKINIGGACTLSSPSSRIQKTDIQIDTNSAQVSCSQSFAHQYALQVIRFAVCCSAQSVLALTRASRAVQLLSQRHSNFHNLCRVCSVLSLLTRAHGHIARCLAHCSASHQHSLFAVPCVFTRSHVYTTLSSSLLSVSAIIVLLSTLSRTVSCVIRSVTHSSADHASRIVNC